MESDIMEIKVTPSSAIIMVYNTYRPMNQDELIDAIDALTLILETRKPSQRKARKVIR